MKNPTWEVILEQKSQILLKWLIIKKRVFSNKTTIFFTNFLPFFYLVEYLLTDQLFDQIKKIS
jgi:hypothetical protein